jgi:hypothetical protein
MKYSLLDEDKRHKIKQIWEEILSEPENYLTDIEELGSISFIDTVLRQIEIQSGAYIYFNDTSQKGIMDMASILLSVREVGRYSSFDNIYRSIRDEIKNQFASMSESTKNLSFNSVETSILDRIFANIKRYSYYFPINGITLEENLKVDFGSIQIFKFDADELKNLIDQDPRVTEATEEEYKKFLKEGFLGNLCIKCSCIGDQKFSEKFARFRVEETLNYL